MDERTEPVEPLEPVRRPPTIAQVIEDHATAAYLRGDYDAVTLCEALRQPMTGPGGAPHPLP